MLYFLRSLTVSRFPMRLVQIAKVLNMTGQELRRELSQVNFGVKPTDREVPDALAKGVIRFIAQKKGLKIDLENLDALLSPAAAVAEEEREAPPAEEQAEVSAEETVTAGVAAPGRKPTSLPRADGLNVLRKLSLEDVSKAAIERHAKEEQPQVSKEDKAEMEREQKILNRVQPRRAGAEGEQEQIKRKEGTVTLPDQISVKEFAEKTGIQVPRVIQTLMKNGVMATVTQSIDYDTAAIVAADLGVTVRREEGAARAELLFSRNLAEILREDTEETVPRPPIVVIMGHVDHGKTALLDAIRETNVVATEAGGITQHIGAYQVERDGRRVTFLDTPGHEAFTAMRARGAQVTDIAVIVVSAEEGVKPTTVEAINHAKEAGVAIIAAITKVDKERADIDRVKGDLAGQGLQPEEWGGEVPVVLTSAVTKQGIPELLDTIILVSDLKGYKANPDRKAVATVIESRLHQSLGALATVIVNTGTLKVGDTFVCGQTMGRVKALMDPGGQRITAVLPSGPARVSGFDALPQVGDILQVVAGERRARELLETLQREQGLRQKRSFADLVSRLSEGQLTQLKVILKTDTQGSLEAIQEALRKQAAASAGLSVKVIHGAVGAVSDSDVMMAMASDAVILAFHAQVPGDVLRSAEREGVQVRSYTVLYQLLEEVDALMKGLVEPEEQESVTGHLEVKAVFLTKKTEQIIGGRVTDGSIKRLPFRLLRGGEEMGTGRITSLKHGDKDIKEAKEGSECGMRVETSLPIQEGDVLECYVRELKRKES